MDTKMCPQIHIRPPSLVGRVDGGCWTPRCVHKYTPDLLTLSVGWREAVGHQGVSTNTDIYKYELQAKHSVTSVS